MASRDPLQPHALLVQVDPSAFRVPLHESVGEPERQPAQLVAPDQFRFDCPRELLHHIRNRVATERVLLREMREVVISPHRTLTLPARRFEPWAHRECPVPPGIEWAW